MTAAVRRRADCRLCGGHDLEQVLALTPTPPANAFVRAEERDRPQQTFPLDVFFCEDCGHVQLLDVVDPELLFENYVYVSGTSPVFVEHFQVYADTIVERFRLGRGDRAVDIGSNDGTLLRMFAGHGLDVLGIDPARAIAEAATADGIETITGFFTGAMAERIRAEHGPAAVVTANNVFAHADDLRGIAAGVRDLLRPDGVFVVEVSYLMDVFEKTLFDTIYHEHLSYHSVAPLRRFFDSIGMELFDVERVDTHGGSLRAYVQHADGPYDTNGSVDALCLLESELGLDRAETLKEFAAHIDDVRDRLTELLRSIRAEGKTVAGFGAPAKATTLMYHFGIGPEIVDFVVDDSPLKQGLFTPGMHIPVVSSDALYEQRPDYALVLAWNFAPAIMRNHAAFRENGGHFIVPLPDVEVI